MIQNDIPSTRIKSLADYKINIQKLYTRVTVIKHNLRKFVLQI